MVTDYFNCFNLGFITCSSCNIVFVSNIRSCRVGNLRVKVGDFVLVNNADDPDRITSAYLAELLDMFDNGKPQNDHYHCYCNLIFCNECLKLVDNCTHSQALSMNRSLHFQCSIVFLILCKEI